jgi:crotonobetainyl-CoA:carnitine CoA-transferase CaiB-like acyl-CoA transferase
VREYVGSGPLAEIVAEEDRTKRELAEAERKREKTELERLKALAAPVLEISEAAEILAHAHLIAAGYHRHKGEYRRARGKR